MDKRIQVDSIYTDFQKAFDKVDHFLLLQKIAYNGIRGDLLRWFKSYVNNRTQKVVINGHSSGAITVTSGVPQGSILGPLLFVMFINDIGNSFKHCQYLLYADDLKIFRCVKDVTDCHLIQEDLDRFFEHCTVNKLHLSLAKCKSITFTKNRNIIHSSYHINNSILNKVSIIKDLGILYDSKLHFDEHIDYITNKAYKLYGFVMRLSTAFKKATTLIYLLNCLIRPQLEYGSVIWNPYYIKYALQIESVQRKFIRAVNFKCFRSKISYEESLLKYSMLSLENRRHFLDTMFLFKQLRNKDCTEITNTISYNIPSMSRRIRDNYPHKLFNIAVPSTNAGQRVPLSRIMRNYNDKLHHIDIFHLSLGSFRAEVLKYYINNSMP